MAKGALEGLTRSLDAKLSPGIRVNAIAPSLTNTPLAEDVRKFMKSHLKFNSYKRWRHRVESCITKHAGKRSADINRFKSKMQRQITGNRIAKR